MIDRTTELWEFYEIVGLAMHGARTCRAFSNPHILIMEQVSKRRGVKIAIIEGDSIDASFYEDELVNGRIEAILDAIDACRGMI